MIHSIDLGNFVNPRFLVLMDYPVSMQGDLSTASVSPTAVVLVDLSTGSTETKQMWPAGGTDRYAWRAVFDFTDKSNGRYAFLVKKAVGAGTHVWVLNFGVVGKAVNVISARAVDLPGGQFLVYETDTGLVKRGIVR